VIGFVTTMPELWETTGKTLKEVTMNFDRYFKKMPVDLQNWLNGIGENIGEYMTNWFQNSGTSAAESASNFAKNLPLAIIGTIMFILASYLFLAEKDYVVKVYQKVFPAKFQERWNLVYKTMKTAVGGYFKAQFKIMGVVCVILFIGFVIVDVKYAFLIALLIALLDFLPFFGTGTVMWPWAVIAFFQNDYKLAIGLIITWAISQFVRQLIQPKMLGDSIGLEPIPTLVLLYLGFRVGGALGLIIAVPVGMIVINLYKAGVFSNFVYSIQILAKDLSKLRKFDEADLQKEGIPTIEKVEEDIEEARRESREPHEEHPDDPAV
ncbi:MAG TPA: AI-2E family transporter, partial [Lachnospiraceae bacterium]|nr:AI-2E family transporter [Lachnospiraceae bacterium]